ncbi:hypothetical protein COY95_01130, partial [Candidatus Woesearchaeota archaeon CG_4_10_14_0_8_um_filter_47_5]
NKDNRIWFNVGTKAADMAQRFCKGCSHSLVGITLNESNGQHGLSPKGIGCFVYKMYGRECGREEDNKNRTNPHTIVRSMYRAVFGIKNPTGEIFNNSKKGN